MFGNLRLVKSSTLSHYMDNTELWRRIGNIAFAEKIRNGVKTTESKRFHKQWILYHSWKSAYLEIEDRIAQIARGLILGESVLADRKEAYGALVERLRYMDLLDDNSPVDLDQVVDRSQDMFIAIQNRYELTAFLRRVQQLDPKVIVEIGTARGGMLYCFCQVVSNNAMLISIDLPGAPNCGGQTETERELFASFGRPAQRIDFIPADSHRYSTREKLEQLLCGQGIDLLFIDGDHSYGGCYSDFLMYKDLVHRDGIIAFHDVAVDRGYWPDIECGLVWDELTAKYGGDKIVDPEGTSDPKRPDGKDLRWGIGMISARNLSNRDF